MVACCPNIHTLYNVVSISVHSITHLYCVCNACHVHVHVLLSDYEWIGVG